MEGSGEPSSPRSPKPAPGFGLFRKSTKTLENTGPLQKDTHQQALIEAAMANKRSAGVSSNASSSAAQPATTSPRRSLKDSVKAALSPRAVRKDAGSPKDGTRGSDGSGTPKVPPKPSGPPPLPKKVQNSGADQHNYIFCQECGARNKTFRTHCVSCEEELEIPDVILQQRAAAAAAAATTTTTPSSSAAAATPATAGAAKTAPPPMPVRRADATNSRVTGSGIASGAQRADARAVFLVHLVDAAGKAITTSGASVELALAVQIEGPAGEIVADISDRGDGTVEVAYRQGEPGEYHVMVSIDDEPVADSPYVLDVLMVVAPALCTATGQALEDGVFSRTKATFDVDTRDVCGNLCAVGGAEVAVLIESVAAIASPVSPRLGASAAAAEPVVRDMGNGSYEVELEYAAAGTQTVRVTVNGSDVKGSPFSVRVDKPPSAGSKWQSKYEDQAEVRRKQREEERLAEIDKAKANFLKHAEEAKAAAAEKERKQLAERERQREIAEHMERMRTEEGDAVRAAVLDKVKAQATHDVYEPVDSTSPRGAGKKWASQFNEEDRTRKEARERERQAEIELAKQGYLEHANEAVKHAQTKEERQLAEEARLAAIEAHQRDLRKQNNLGGRAQLDDDNISSGTSAADGEDAPAGGEQADGDDGRSGSASASSEGEPLSLTPFGRPFMTCIDTGKGKKGAAVRPAVGAVDDVSSSLTASEDDEPPPPRGAKGPGPASPRGGASPGGASPRGTSSPPESPRSGGKQLARSKRGDVPDTEGVTVSLADFRRGAASFSARDDVDVSQLEAYLSESDFVTVFGMKKSKFYEFPNWRRLQIKKEKNVL